MKRSWIVFDLDGKYRFAYVYCCCIQMTNAQWNPFIDLNLMWFILLIEFPLQLTSINVIYYFHHPLAHVSAFIIHKWIYYSALMAITLRIQFWKLYMKRSHSIETVIVLPEHLKVYFIYFVCVCGFNKKIP